MRKKLLSLLLAVALTLSLLISGCSNQEGSNNADGKKKDSVTLRLDAEISTLDPSYASSTTSIGVINQIFDSLYKVYLDHSIESSLAESHTISEDSLTYTFKLREGVKFHNGEELKASDIVFTINRALDSAWQYSTVEQVESASAISDYEVAIKLKNIYAPFLEIISGLPILNEKAVTEAGDSFGQNPIGTGPFKFVSYENASILKLTRFDDYFKGAARIKDVTYNVITDPNTANISLETGETDFGALSASAYESIKANKNLVVEQLKSSNLRFVMLNTEKEPFDNKLVRQAINYAIDREFIVKSAENGLAEAHSTFLTPLSFGYSDNVPKYEYNPEKAKDLLKQAGITTPLDIGVIKTIDGSFKKVAEILQSNLADIGITTNIEMLEQNKYLEDSMTGNYLIGSMGADTGIDADSASLFFTPENMNGGYNLARYNNPVVTELFSKGKTTLDSSERLKIYEECFKIIEDESVYIPVYNAVGLVAHNKNLHFDDVTKTTAIYTMYWE